MRRLVQGSIVGLKVLTACERAVLRCCGVSQIARCNLQAGLEGLPDCLLEGELRQCTLILRNTGASALRGIRVVTSGPDVYVPPDNADLSSPSLASVLPGEALPWALHPPLQV